MRIFRMLFPPGWLGIALVAAALVSGTIVSTIFSIDISAGAAVFLGVFALAAFVVGAMKRRTAWWKEGQATRLSATSTMIAKPENTISPMLGRRRAPLSGAFAAA